MFKYAAAIAITTLFASTAALADAHANAARLIAMPGAGTMQLTDVAALPAHFDKDTLVILCDLSCQKALHAVAQDAAGSKQVEMPLKVMMDHDAQVARILGRTVN